MHYVWVNLNDGHFSNSWNITEYPEHVIDEVAKQHSPEDGWKLIKYECVNDPNFVFYNQMKLK